MQSNSASLVAATVASVLVACGGSQPAGQVARLPSGKEIKIVGVGKVYFTEGEPGLMLKYQTELSLDDDAALQAEIEEIWSMFVHDVEKANLAVGIISANEPADGGFISTNRAWNFVFRKSPDGKWKPVSGDR